ncbi:MAG TPA: HNH endonuclease [Pyrinomonadaceae bacterium]|jgi:hypothetical protein
MKQIPLTKNQFTIVDDELFDYLNKWKWHYNSGYAERKENGRHVRMHRVILKTRKFVDHINGDPLDNRKENLRPATKSTNAMNMKKSRGASIYKGVSKDGDRWRAQICKNNRRVFSESAPKERWGAMIYDLNAPLVFGEYARLNFVPVGKIAGALPR